MDPFIAIAALVSFNADRAYSVTKTQKSGSGRLYNTVVLPTPGLPPSFGHHPSAEADQPPPEDLATSGGG